jgi:type VI secretion system protein VasG
MITVDIKTLLSRLNPYCTRALEGAAGLCVSRTHYEVTVEHFLTKLLEDPQSDLPLIFRQFDLDLSRVKKALDQTVEEFRRPGLSHQSILEKIVSGLVPFFLFS